MDPINLLLKSQATAKYPLNTTNLSYHREKNHKIVYGLTRENGTVRKKERRPLY